MDSRALYDNKRGYNVVRHIVKKYKLNYTRIAELGDMSDQTITNGLTAQIVQAGIYALKPPMRAKLYAVIASELKDRISNELEYQLTLEYLAADLMVEKNAIYLKKAPVIKAGMSLEEAIELLKANCQ